MSDSAIVTRLLAMHAKNELVSGDEFLELSKKSSPGYLNDVELAKGKLDWSPRSNWVEDNGGLPEYIEKIALGIMKSTGYPREKAIPMAIERIKVWSTGKGVNADTQAKALEALAQWNALKAKAAARRAASKAKK